MTEEDSLKTLEILEKRIIPGQLTLNKLPRLLEYIKPEHRLKVVQLLMSIINSDPERQCQLLNEDDVTGILSKIPSPQSLQTLNFFKLEIVQDLDFKKMKKILDVITEKRDRLVILKELSSHSINSQKNLDCYDLHNILGTIPKDHAIPALQFITHLIHPNLDLAKASYVFENVHNASHNDVLQTLIGACDTQITSFGEIRSIIIKMDQPFRGLEFLKPRIQTDIDVTKLPTALSVIPSIKRLDTLHLVKDIVGESMPALRPNDYRSILMLLEDSVKIQALRLLKTFTHLEDGNDISRIIDCFPGAQKPVAEIILQGPEGRVTEDYVFPN
eukprot:TRINITY_DN5280_c2_g1_i3.p1 TRINITY_DN5280_c2_g1~~TRINITY_DN5280_c2_g1_i3.p1  ORF type:complete len:330 (-),score=23.42 TRINITY_DN5280_c2_g1_i3:31-1020(-)